MNGRMFNPRFHVPNTPVMWDMEIQESAEGWAEEMFRKNGRSKGTFTHKRYVAPDDMPFEENIANLFFTMDHGRNARHRVDALIRSFIAFYNEGVCYRYGFDNYREPGCTLCWRQSEAGCELCSRAASRVQPTTRL
eukprot:GHVQ01001508.1.p1 GENE.GHVQ01001508.1~~GHVQ01001508.1.p1  ORF type:complete len:136 (+),score=5.33 GHVQ01001508.1:473-880(+)